MKEKRVTILRYIFEIILIITVSLMYYLNQPIYTPKILYIPKGSINKIITQLQNNGYDVCKLDSYILRVIGVPQSGWIDLKKSPYTRWDFLYKIATSKAALQKVTLIPGETTYIFLTHLAKELHLNKEKLLSEYKREAPYPEGLLYPETYELPRGIDAKRVIEILLNLSLQRTKELSKKFFGIYNEKQWLHYVIIASIIQKESANEEEMPIVSSVIYNRLKKGMRLQMDGTLNYGKYSHIKITARRIREDRTFYNTYKHKGLPKFPISTVSVASIEAALFPAKTNYLYFVKSKSGRHNFSCNYSTHLANIRRATK